MTLGAVAVVSPGEMGAGIGSVLVADGLDVITSLAGRSALTRTRAAEAGMRDAGSIDDVVAGCDLLLSVLVPSQAVPIAHEVAGAMVRTGARPVYAECNAIAPQTVAPHRDHHRRRWRHVRRRRHHRRATAARPDRRAPLLLGPRHLDLPDSP